MRSAPALVASARIAAISAGSSFAHDDHRAFNRQGAAFDRGETFSGFDYGAGLAAVERLRALVPAGMTMGQMALRWILTFPAVTCAIPGAKTPQQVEENLKAADLAALSDGTMEAIERLYWEQVRPSVHQLW